MSHSFINYKLIIIHINYPLLLILKQAKACPRTSNLLKSSRTEALILLILDYQRVYSLQAPTTCSLSIFTSKMAIGNMTKQNLLIQILLKRSAFLQSKITESNRDKSTQKRRQKSIANQRKSIDSLRKLIEKQQKAIDSIGKSIEIKKN